MIESLVCLNDEVQRSPVLSEPKKFRGSSFSVTRQSGRKNIKVFVSGRVFFFHTFHWGKQNKITGFLLKEEAEYCISPASY